MEQDSSNIEESEKSEDINNNLNKNSIQIDADKKYEECSSINSMIELQVIVVERKCQS